MPTGHPLAVRPGEPVDLDRRHLLGREGGLFLDELVEQGVDFVQVDRLDLLDQGGAGVEVEVVPPAEQVLLPGLGQAGDERRVGRHRGSAPVAADGQNSRVSPS